MLLPLLWLVAAAHIVYGIVRFRGLLTSPRYVRHRPGVGFWRRAFVEDDAWTVQGRALRARFAEWNLGLLVLAAAILLARRAG